MITIEGALKEISMLGGSKAIQATDIQVKVIKSKSNFFAEQICTYFNESIGKGKFPNCLKLSNIAPVFKKDAGTSKHLQASEMMIPVYFQYFLRHLRNFYKIN